MMWYETILGMTGNMMWYDLATKLVITGNMICWTILGDKVGGLNWATRLAMNWKQGLI
jgi:hypothetical protein